MAVKITTAEVVALKFLGAYPAKRISEWDLCDHLKSKGYTGVQSQNTIDSMLYRDDYKDKAQAAFVTQVVMGPKSDTVGFLLTQRGRRIADKLRGGK